MTDNNTLFADDVLDELLASAWQTFLESDITRVSHAELADDALFASISIAGPRQATIVIACDSWLATSCASQVLMTPADELAPEDAGDVLGELANIVAGNLKGVMATDEKWSLSLPVVSAAEQVIHGSTLRSRSLFECAGGAVVCELREPM